MKIVSKSITLLLLFSVISCSTAVKKIVADQSKLIRQFSGKSILKRGDIYTYSVYHEGSVNSYFFKKSNDDFVLLSENIQFQKHLESHGQFDSLLRIMHSYNIKEVTAEFSTVGIDLKFYLDEGELFYISDQSKILNQEWKKYLANSRKIDEHWFVHTTKK